LNKFIFVPIGSYEQHGTHLPPETDYLIAKKITKIVSTAFNGNIIKGIKIGISPEHQGFENTKSISQEEFILQIENILKSNQDTAKYFLINAHGGNVNALNSIQELNKNNLLVLNTFSLIKEELKTIRSSEIGGICHAGEFETSIMLFLYPHLVHMNRISKNDVKYAPFLDPNYEKEKKRDWKTINYSKSGILGDPFHATVKKGELWFNSLTKNITSSIKKFLA